MKIHSPERSLIKFRYKKTRVINPRIGTEKEFEESWIAGIASKADIAFFNIYPQVMVKPEPKTITPVKVIQEISEFEAEDESLTLD